MSALKSLYSAGCSSSGQTVNAGQRFGHRQRSRHRCAPGSPRHGQRRPVDASGELLPSVQLGVQATSLRIPAVIESGPILAAASLKIFRQRLFARLFHLRVLQPRHTFLRVQAPPSSAMPGLTTTISATTRQRLEVAAARSMRLRCSVSARSRSAPWPGSPTARRRAGRPDGYVVIFPWRLAA